MTDSIPNATFELANAVYDAVDAWLTEGRP